MGEHATLATLWVVYHFMFLYRKWSETLRSVLSTCIRVAFVLCFFWRASPFTATTDENIYTSSRTAMNFNVWIIIEACQAFISTNITTWNTSYMFNCDVCKRKKEKPAIAHVEFINPQILYHETKRHVEWMGIMEEKTFIYITRWRAASPTIS